MGENAQRVSHSSDINTSSAGITSSIVDHKVYVNSKLVSVDGSAVADHLPVDGVNTHTSVTTANGSSTVKAGGLGINRTGDNDSCGHARAGGYDKVKVG